MKSISIPGETHRWFKSTKYSIKTSDGHYIACTNHKAGKKYTLFSNDGKQKTFNRASQAKAYANKHYTPAGAEL